MDKKSQPESNRGVLTIAVGKTEFIEMAVDMALSYKHFNDEPVSCIVDSESKKIIEENYFSVFDKLILMPQRYDVGRIRKFSCAELSPYESTIYLDSDILVLNNISHLWKEAELNNYITMIGDYLEADTEKVHHGFSVAKLIEKEKINKYFKTNSGFFHFMKESSKAYFDSCKEKYVELFYDKEFKEKGWLGDEIAIGIISQKFNVYCFKVPSPMMWEKQLARLKRKENTHPICHFIAPIPTATVKWLVKRAVSFRKLSALPANGAMVWMQLNRRRKQSYKKSFFKKMKNRIRRHLKSFQFQKIPA